MEATELGVCGEVIITSVLIDTGGVALTFVVGSLIGVVTVIGLEGVGGA